MLLGDATGSSRIEPYGTTLMDHLKNMKEKLAQFCLSESSWKAAQPSGQHIVLSLETSRHFI